MKTRREFIVQSAAAGVCLQGGFAVARGRSSVGAKSSESRIKRVVPRDDTVLRNREVDGGAVSVTWAANGLQYASFADVVFVQKPVANFHARMFALSGDSKHAAFAYLPNYPDMPAIVPDDPRGSASYFGWGCLAVDGVLYQYLRTPNHVYMDPDGTFPPDFEMSGVKLIYSPDNGRTWHNQDGSSPVVWERWTERSRENMVFFQEEPDGALSGVCLLQMGKDYRLNKDGYIYGYSLNGIDKPAGNQLVSFRVPKSRILDRRSYEFFAGTRSDGRGAWTRDISARHVLHTFPSGPVASGSIAAQGHSSPWTVTVFYIEQLQTYMLSGLRVGVTADGRWFTKPSYLGVWVGRTPWGPFTQVHEEESWTPGRDPDARVAVLSVVPKWIAADGKSFWLTWYDYAYKGAGGEVWNPDADIVPKLKGIADKPEGAKVSLEWDKKYMAYSCFSAMRFDIEV